MLFCGSIRKQGVADYSNAFEDEIDWTASNASEAANVYLALSALFCQVISIIINCQGVSYFVRTVLVQWRDGARYFHLSHSAKRVNMVDEFRRTTPRVESNWIGLLLKLQQKHNHPLGTGNISFTSNAPAISRRSRLSIGQIGGFWSCLARPTPMRTSNSHLIYSARCFQCT